MDLKIKDVVELLNISESTVRRWLTERKIPAYKLNGQYRFSRIEIENWMMQQKLSDTSEYHMAAAPQEEQIYPPKEQGGNQQYLLYRAIHKGGVFHHIHGATKEDVIRNTVMQIAEPLGVDPSILAELLLDREKMMATGFNHGVAVPHARECVQHIPHDFVPVVFLEKPIEYGSLDNLPVHTLFFLFGTSDKTHLQLLAKIAHFTSKKENLALLATRPSKETFMDAVRTWEATLKGPTS